LSITTFSIKFPVNIRPGSWSFLFSLLITKYEISPKVLQKLGEGVEKIGLNVLQLRTLRQVKNCRTAAMGGHIDACDSFGNISISYNSCRNRHCPKCQGKNREEWIQARD
jgi:hypothetical protein